MVMPAAKARKRANSEESKWEQKWKRWRYRRKKTSAFLAGYTNVMTHIQERIKDATKRSVRHSSLVVEVYEDVIEDSPSIIMDALCTKTHELKPEDLRDIMDSVALQVVKELKSEGYKAHFETVEHGDAKCYFLDVHYELHISWE